MNRLFGLGFLSLVGTFFLGCDDSSSGGSGGAGGTDGSAGSAGDAGSAGTTTGNVTTTGTNDFTGVATCSGCVEVEVPVVGANSEDNASDQVGLAFYPQGDLFDLSNAVVTWRVMALANDPDLMVAPYAENGDPYPGAYRLQAPLTAANFPPMQWVDVVFDLSAYPAFGSDAGVFSATDAGVTIIPVDAGSSDAGVGDAGLILDGGVVLDGGVALDGGVDAGIATQPDSTTPAGDPLAASFEQPLNPAFDKSLVSQLGLYVGSGPNLEGSATAKIAIDSVTFTGAVGITDITFDTDVQGLTINNYNIPEGTQGPLHHP